MSHRAAEPHAGGAPRAPLLSRSTLMMLRRLLNAYREGWLLEDRLAAVARMTAEDARRGRAAAEEMLVALKREWAALREVRAMSAFDARDLLGRLVTHAIGAYYELRPAPDPGSSSVAPGAA